MRESGWGCGEWVRVWAPKKVAGGVYLPPSKSVCNRLLVMEALSGGRVRPERLSKSRDTQVLCYLLQAASSERHLYVEDGGAPLRFLLAYLTAVGGEWVIDCGEALRRRPHTTLVKVLEELGAVVKPVGDRLFPLRLSSSGIKRGRVFIREPVSSQFVSALMLVGWYVRGGLQIVVEGCPSVDYVVLTERLLRAAGVEVSLCVEGTCLEIYVPFATPLQQSIPVSGDWTLLPYFVSMVGLCGGVLSVEGLLGWQAFENVLPLVERFDVCLRVSCKVVAQEGGSHKGSLTILVEEKEPCGDVSVVEVDLTEFPDASVALLPLFAGATGEHIVMHFASNLWAKESDRLRILYRMGGYLRRHVLLRGSTLELWGERCVPPLVVEHGGDHRIAMLASVLAGLSGEVLIPEPAVVEKSTPQWWELLRDVGWEVDLWVKRGV